MMKKRKFYQFFATVLALALAGCNHDTLSGEDQDDNQHSKDAVYMNVAVQLPTGPGTRSATNPGGGSTDGTEVGKDYENAVKSILLVLADKDNKFICCAEQSESFNQSGSTVTAVQSISKSVLAEYYNEMELNPNDINVFVFCNPTDALRRIFTGIKKGDETWHEQVCTLSEQPGGGSDNAAIWGGVNHAGGFLMSSYEIATKKLPMNFSDWDKYTTKENPFQLSGNNGGSGNLNNEGAIKVERSVARFDFKDGSPATTDANTYNVIYDQKDKTKCLAKIQLVKMALVNMSKNFYYLRRTSDDGMDKSETNNFLLGGKETNTNYVVDTDAAAKADGTIISGNKYDDHFNFCLGRLDGDKWLIDGNARNQWYHSTITSVLTGSNDEEEDWNTGKSDAGYKIWRYVTENTIPGGTSNQKHGISTGIVFKGKMEIGADLPTDSKLYEALSMTAVANANDPILYAYGNELFVRWTEVRAIAIQQGTSHPMYQAVFGNPTNTPTAIKTDGSGAVYSNDSESADSKWNVWFNEKSANDATALSTFKNAATRAKFTLYQRSDDDAGGSGYYCHYYYWNRHNDNTNPAIMGSMEFGVVRNNVYKLAVTNISKLGHPRITENDPDPEDPDNPDEDGDIYLSVSVEVLPWVVRINNIEF